MKIIWNKKTAEWFRNASEYTGYSRELTGLLTRYIRPDYTVCDIGCGNGITDLELAQYCKEITCVDISAEAINDLKIHAAEKGLKNLHAIVCDGKDIKGSFDVVTAFFHGGGYCFENYFHLAQKCMIIASHSDTASKTGPENRHFHKHYNASGLSEYLKEKNIPYSVSFHSIEYGQPLRGIDDAKDYVRTYALPMTEEELDRYVGTALVKTGNPEFPLYLPKKRSFALYVIHNPGFTGDSCSSSPVGIS